MVATRSCTPRHACRLTAGLAFVVMAAASGWTRPAALIEGAASDAAAASAAPTRPSGPYAAPPICSAGGPYVSECGGVTLSGATASDPDGDPITYAWTSDCDGDGVFGEPEDGSFDVATVLNAVFRGPDPCGSACVVRLTATARANTCTSTTTVTVDDTLPPVIDFGGTLGLGPGVTFFPRTRQGGPMLHSHGMVYERPQLTTWWTDYELPDNLYEFDATQPPGSTLTALTQVTVLSGGIEDITFDPNDQSLWYLDLAGIVRHIDQAGTPLPPFGGFPTAGQFGLAWAEGFLWAENPSFGATQYTLGGAPTGRTIRYSAPPEYGLGYDFDRDLLWTGHWSDGRFRAYDEDTGTLVFTSPVIVLPDGNGAGHDVGYGACHLWVGTESLAEDVIYAIPVLGGICDVSVECDEVPSPAGPTATDNCDGPLPVVSGETVVPGRCANEYTIVRTWTATDSCGNDALRTQTISVFDSTPPQVTCPGPASYRCRADVPPCRPGDATATDNCPSVAVTCLPDTDDGGAGCVASPLIITRTWRATDACGLVATCSQTITVADDAPPVLSARTPSGGCDVILAVDAGPGDVASASPAVDVVDACGATVVNDRTAGGADATDLYPCGITVVTFDAADACGGAATCRVSVSVAPASPPPDVGAALRVRKDAAGAPVLDWSLAGPGAGPRFCVLRRENDPRDLMIEPLACGIAATSWTEAAPAPRWICYDVRAIDCSRALSAD